MDIQSTLSLLIQVLVMGFVSLVLFQGITGLFLEFGKAQAVATFHTTAATPSFQPAISTTLAATNFDQLPDPWFTTDITPTAIQQEPVVLQFPKLRLLPPAAELQPKAATKKSTKSAKPKSTKTSKTSQPKTALTPRKSRKSAAA